MAKTSSKSKTAYYASYKSGNKWKSNRKKKLERLLKLQPNNQQIVDALKDINYRRKTPQGKSIWSKTNINIAKIFKQFTGKASHDLFSSNPLTKSAALMARNENSSYKLPEGKVSFSLGARAHDSKGSLTWA